MRRTLHARRPNEPKAFEELLSQHLDAMYAAALRLCGGNTTDAEDLLQDAVLRAFQSVHQLRESGAARAWFVTILARTNLNRVRARRRRAETLVADFSEYELEEAMAGWTDFLSPEDHTEQSLSWQHLTRVLDALDDELRVVVWLCDVEEYRQREVAQMLDIPEGTVASRLFRARRQLRAALQSRRALEARSRAL